MSVNVDEIAQVINTLYPLSGQSSWDNSGFQLNLHNNTDKVLVCLDITKDIIQEASELGCRMIVSHHPLLFHAMKNIDSYKSIDDLIISLIKNDISLYSAHTSADNAIDGINKTLADMIGLNDVKFIEPLRTEKYFKISVVVPDEKAEEIRKAIYEAGGGRYGKYKESSLTIPGYGEFVPTKGAKPYIGKTDKKEEIAELRIETLVEQEDLDKVIKSVRLAHPYEEPVIDIYELANRVKETAGVGVYGHLKSKSTVSSIIEEIKNKFHIDKVRLHGDTEAKIKTIGICGGAGGDLIPKARELGIDLFITGEVKHNIYLENDINILELGHYDSEKCFCEMMANSLQNAFDEVKYKITVYKSKKENAPYTVY